MWGVGENLHTVMNAFLVGGQLQETNVGLSSTQALSPGSGSF